VSFELPSTIRKGQSSDLIKIIADSSSLIALEFELFFHYYSGKINPSSHSKES